MLGRAKQCGKARARIKAREAGPIDGAFTTDEGGSLQITQQCVIRDALRRTHLHKGNWSHGRVQQMPLRRQRQAHDFRRDEGRAVLFQRVRRLRRQR